MQKDPLLNYLKIFSWFLLSFSAVGFIAITLNIADYGSKSDTLGLLSLQITVAAINLYGFKLLKEDRISRLALLYSGWALILALIIVGQIWVNNSDINL